MSTVKHPTIRNAKVVDPTTLVVEWDGDGRRTNADMPAIGFNLWLEEVEARRRVDLSAWILAGGPRLAALSDRVAFARAKVSDDGTRVVWTVDGDHLSIEASELSTMMAEQRANWA